MTTREYLKQQLDSFDEEEIQQIAQFIEFLQYRHQQTSALNDTPDEQILTDFKQAWHEAMTGQTVSIERIWEQLANV